MEVSIIMKLVTQWTQIHYKNTWTNGPLIVPSQLVVSVPSCASEKSLLWSVLHTPTNTVQLVSQSIVTLYFIFFWVFINLLFGIMAYLGSTQNATQCRKWFYCLWISKIQLNIVRKSLTHSSTAATENNKSISGPRGAC